MPAENSLHATLAPLSGLQIALIDDDPGVLRALTLILKTAQCRVAPFSSAAEALEAIRSDQGIQLIVSDLRMPGCSGVEFFEQLRSLGDGRPFLLMSGHATNAEVTAARKVGIAGFLPKPFTPASLATEVGKILTGLTN